MAPPDEHLIRRHGRSLASRLLLAFTLALTACSRDSTPQGSGAAEARSNAPDTSKVPADAGSGDNGMWPMPGRTHAATRYSHLTEITRTNVSSLRLAWSFSTGVLRGHKAAPLVVGANCLHS